MKMLSRLSPISLLVLLFTGICISWTACKPGSTTGAKSAGKTVTTGDFKGMKFEDIPGTDVKYARQYDSTGVLLIEGFVQNNKKVGQWIQYASGGDLGLINNYINGELEGVVLRYGFRNQVDLKSTYHRGQLDGPWIAYKFGKMVEERNYKDGKLDGTVRIYDERTFKVKQEAEYKNGLQDGYFRYYDENGNVTVEYRYKNGEKIGGGMTKK